MTYTSYSLNGAWEMDYCEEAYIGRSNPWRKGTLVEHAVPGYWEDMTEAFALAPFFRHLRINPEYGIQRYPIADGAPDMALPNIVGNFFYRRTFRCDDVGAPAAIHFEGVQNAVSVWLNDVFVTRHEGYSAPFDVEIPEGVLGEGENVIVLSISNYRLPGYAGEPVIGLTSRAVNEYTGGITGDMELRVYNSPLRDVVLYVLDDCECVTAEVVSVKDVAYSWAVYDGDRVLMSGEGRANDNGQNRAANFTSGNGQCVEKLSFDTAELTRWSPETPKLYTLELTCGQGTLRRQFGVRRLTVDGVHFKLNGLPRFLRGICEHCYYPETVHPGHDVSFYRKVIKKLKELGFDFIRFHTYIPPEEYLQAADELGMLVQVESPNNTTLGEWKEIVSFCRRHTSVVIYCCGNELQMDDPFIEHLRLCAKEVHNGTDALFSPMSALRGLEYCWVEPKQEPETVEVPFKHHPRRLQMVGEFSDMYGSYALGQLSYTSLDADPGMLDEWSRVYNVPRVSHEICIDGTYTDLSLKDRYKNSRIGKTEMFSSIERHLESKGMLERAPLYFKNSSEWQRRVRKYCFEAARRCENMAGFDFLGPIDTHWHTFGYDVGMMNEFYELKPGETVRNVRMYNSATVLLTDLGKKINFTEGQELACGIYTSHYGKEELRDAYLTIRLSLDGSIVERRQVTLSRVKNGAVIRLCDFSVVLPQVEKPCAMKLSVTLDGGDTYAENEWELYLFPESSVGKKPCGMAVSDTENLIVSDGMSAEALVEALRSGKDVLLLGAGPFESLHTSFRIALAGRTAENLSTVIEDHPALDDLPHEGFCGWQFCHLLTDGRAVCFEDDRIPFHPLIEVVSTHKYAIRQAALFEYRVMNGRLLVCSLHFAEDDPAASWLAERLYAYVQSDAFQPRDVLDEELFWALVNTKVLKAGDDANRALNPNDKTALRGSGK